MTQPQNSALAVGDPLPQPAPSADARTRMAIRRSASAHTLAAPAPSAAEIEELLRLAARTPDHGKLFPWRFILIEGAAKASLVAKLEKLAAGQPNAAKAAAVLGKLRNPPLTIAVISRVQPAAIPEWEQVLSAGAVCMNLLNAADALGYGANWITDWYAYDPEASALLGLAAGERIAGFVHVGTPSEPPLERQRPDVAALTSRLTP
ncbi:MAG: nitroreductase [Hyphomonadaceae bacterium]